MQQGGEPRWLVVNIGDSRVYRLLSERLEQVTVDHSIAQEMVDAGRLTRDEMSTFEGRNVIILDDEVATGGSILELVRALRKERAGRISLACTHGLFTGKAIERLGSLDDLEEIVTTNTVPIAAEKRLPNMTVLSIAPLLAEAISRIHQGESVSALFVNTV